MSSDDDVMSLDDFSSTDSSSESSESGEFEMVSIVRPYADEPLAHSSDQSEDDENDFSFVLVETAQSPKGLRVNSP